MLMSSIANISGTDQDIENPKTTLSTIIFFSSTKNWVNFTLLTKKL